MDENVFWLRLWSTVAAAIVTIAAIVGLVSVRHSDIIANMVEKGASPIEARCAIINGASQDMMCVAYIASNKGN
jgi:hypothetical protein